jgi:hypothetical protein
MELVPEIDETEIPTQAAKGWGALHKFRILLFRVCVTDPQQKDKQRAEHNELEEREAHVKV